MMAVVIIIKTNNFILLNHDLDKEIIIMKREHLLLALKALVDFAEDGW